MLLDLIAQQGLPELDEMGVEQARTVRDKQRLPPGPDAVVRDHQMTGPGGNVAIREYRPIGATGALGGLVYFHGGGFVLGSLDSHDALCRQLAVDSGCAVISVDYRLAPEHKFPSGVDDAYAATSWVFEHAGKLGIDGKRIAVGGDSAGGALATAAAIIAKRKGGPKIAFQLLLYPVTDMRTFDTISHAENADGYFLTRASMVWFRDLYFVSPDDRSNPLGSPLAGDADELSGLPPALVITAGFDPLRDEAEAYAHKLQAAGVPCKLTRYDGAIHAFMSMYAYLECGRAAVREAADALRGAVGD